jgi:hypothetical protein
LDAAFRGNIEMFGFILKQSNADVDATCLRGKSLNAYLRMDFSKLTKDGREFTKTEFIKN